MPSSVGLLQSSLSRSNQRPGSVLVHHVILLLSALTGLTYLPFNEDQVPSCSSSLFICERCSESWQFDTPLCSPGIKSLQKSPVHAFSLGASFLWMSHSCIRSLLRMKTWLMPLPRPEPFEVPQPQGKDRNRHPGERLFSFIPPKLPQARFNLCSAWSINLRNCWSWPARLNILTVFEGNIYALVGLQIGR